MKLKCDFHLHSSDDPVDVIRFSSQALIDRAAVLGFHALSFTLHGAFGHHNELVSYAKDRNILLVPGIECCIERKHVVVLLPKPDPELEQVKTFDALRSYRNQHPESFIFAPHPFYPNDHCLQEKLEKNLDLFDAIEYCHWYFSWFNRYNRKAVKLAQKCGKPLIGTSDAHVLGQFGKTFSVIDAEPDPVSIIQAMKDRKIELITRPLSILAFCHGMAHFSGNDLARFYRKSRGIPDPIDEYRKSP